MLFANSERILVKITHDTHSFLVMFSFMNPKTGSTNHRKGPKRAEKDRKGPKKAEKDQKEPKRTKNNLIKRAEKGRKELDRSEKNYY